MSRWRSFFKPKLPKGKLGHIDVSGVIQQALSSAGLLKSAKKYGESFRQGNQHDSSDRAQPTAPFFWDTAGTGADSLDYKVYLPPAVASSVERVSLIVMLHGCTQDPDDFALGTRMNELAERDGFVVAYPQQPMKSNSSKCWNWFRPEDQFRNGGEPAKIAQMIRDVIERYPIDPSRVYVAGMSAGAAMAIVLTKTYPELFAAAASHSGLPYRSASNVVTALSAMKNARTGEQTSINEPTAIPLLVLHGDQDRTVDPQNAEIVVRQAMSSWPREDAIASSQKTVVSDGGRTCERLLFPTASGKVAVEQWTIRGAGHQWSGGNAKGSHTDALGPDATDRIVRFFNATHRSR
jgi:poly(hydroxyalkanoate) depolymerase family esterase